MATIVRTAALAALMTGLETRFAAAYSSPKPLVYKDICSEIPSTKKATLLAIADMLPQLREWVGSRVFHNPAEFSQLIENPHYELSMAVDADDVEDDEMGGYFLSADGLAERAQQNPDVLAAAALQAGTSKLCFDGQFFFDTDHPIDGKNGIGTQINYEASGRALTAANWDFVRARMASYKAGPGQELIGVDPNAVMVPTQLLGQAKRIFEAETLPNDAGTAPQTNIYRGTATVIHNPRLNTEPTAWYALDLRSILKPLVYVKRKATKFVMLNRPNDQGMFEENKIKFGVDQREGVGYGAWFRAYKAVA